MKILCVIKQVPDSNAAVRVRPDGKDLDPAGLKLVVDPFDEFGVELAVQLREKGQPVTEIVVITVGSEKAAEALRTALAIGADRAVHLCDPKFDSANELFFAHLIARAVKKLGETFDLIVCGKQNIDLDGGAVGPALAEFLDLPHVGAVQGLEFSDRPAPDGQAGGGKRFTARRRIEGAEEVVEGALPALLTIEKGLVEARYPSLPNLMKAKKKDLKVLTSADLPGETASEAGTQLERLSPPAARADCRFVEGEPADVARELVRLLREEAKVI